MLFSMLAKGYLIHHKFLFLVLSQKVSENQKISTKCK